MKKPPAHDPLKKSDFTALSEFRYQMRRYERFSENAVQAEGITPLQYLLLLHIKGYQEREWATIGELAERLQAHPQRDRQLFWFNGVSDEMLLQLYEHSSALLAASSICPILRRWAASEMSSVFFFRRSRAAWSARTGV